MDNSKANILYVDDESNNLVGFTSLFRRHFNVHTASSAKEGIKILREHPIEVIITDQRMPEMTGVQFLEAIMPDYPDTMRLILTGYTDIEAIISSINCGHVFRYFTKPWEENEMRQTIETAVCIYRLNQENQALLQVLQEKIKNQQKMMTLFRLLYRN